VLGYMGKTADGWPNDTASLAAHWNHKPRTARGADFTPPTNGAPLAVATAAV